SHAFQPSRYDTTLYRSCPKNQPVCPASQKMAMRVSSQNRSTSRSGWLTRPNHRVRVGPSRPGTAVMPGSCRSKPAPSPGPRDTGTPIEVTAPTRAAVARCAPDHVKRYRLRMVRPDPLVAAQVNWAQYEAGQTAGHSESFYLRANHPSRPL